MYMRATVILLSPKTIPGAAPFSGHISNVPLVKIEKGIFCADPRVGSTR